jgi:DNA-binding MarR family transcriptional regulator
LDDESLDKQATELESMLPTVMRRLFTLNPDHPVAEMPVAQLRVCTILQHGAKTLSAVSDELGVSVSATTQIADRMERAGLVERTMGVDDRRTRYLTLSTHGLEIMRQRRETRIRRVREALEQMPPEHRNALHNYVRELLDAVIATAPEIAHADPIGIRQEQN